jgi:hypothetical protein
VTAVLILPETDGESFLANLIDRPFLRHVVEFVTDQGIRKILVVGPAARKAQAMESIGRAWDGSIEYREAHSISGYEVAPIAGNEKCLFASVACWPQLPLKRQLELAAGTIVYGANGNWTGWALVEPRDVALMPPLRDHAAMLSYVQSLRNYAKLSADLEFRCGSPEDLWRAHMDALDSNLSRIFHGGLEVRPAVWMGRNASVAASAEIHAPAYIGENSRIGPGAQIGPFAVIAKDCLIAPRTIIRHAVIAPGTYAGSDLELDQLLVNKRHLFDVRFGVSVDRVDYPILDGVFDFHWPAILRRARGSLGRWPWRRAEVLETPAADAETNWRTPTRHQ